MHHSRILVPLGIACAIALVLTSCSGGDSAADRQPIVDGTFTKAISADPGSLDPLTAVSPEARETIAYSYESLISVDEDGTLSPWLAESWEASGNTVTFTLKDGILCSDGSAFTASTVAANIDFHADADNGSFYFGSLVKEGTVAEADDSARTVTVTSAAPDPFLETGIGSVQLVCDAGLADQEALATTTLGTGPFVLDESVPEDRYTFQRRDEYAWGPNDVTAETEGLPQTVVLRVVTDESTRTNLLLSGDVQAADVSGPERSRAEAASLFSAGSESPVGEVMFNEKSDRVLADPVVREALVTALDRDAILSVLTEDRGTVPTSLVTLSPLACVADEAPWSLPDTSIEDAAALLDGAGWVAGSDGIREKVGKRLEVVFIFDEGSATGPAAGELIAESWSEIGVDTELVTMNGASWTERLYETFDWDAGFVQVTTGEPSFLATFFSAPEPPDGNNFMFVQNPEYSELVATASTASLEDTCQYWVEAEKALVERYDVLPIANLDSPIFGNGAEFANIGYIDPSTIRLFS